MYERFYGLQEKPFNVTPDPRFLYLSPGHREALAHLQYAVQERIGFVAIIGEVGTGKTTLVHAMLSGLGSKVNTAFLFSTCLTAKGLFRLMVADYGINSKARTKAELLLELNQYLLRQYSQGNDSVLIVDEAQNLSLRLLEELRMLSNLETDRDKLLQIILVGQPELATKLALPQMRQLRQRIGWQYRIFPLDLSGTGEYIQHRLKVAGLTEGALFDQPAIEIIYRRSRGIPRLINMICDNMLLMGYANGKGRVDSDLASEVVADLQAQGVLPALPDDSENTIRTSGPSGQKSTWWRQHVWRPLMTASGLLLGTVLFSLPPLSRDSGEAHSRALPSEPPAALSCWNSYLASSLPDESRCAPQDLPAPSERCGSDSPREPEGSSLYSVQVASFQEESQAHELVETLGCRGCENVFVVSYRIPELGRRYRVMVGTYEDKDAARQAARLLLSEGLCRYAIPWSLGADALSRPSAMASDAAPTSPISSSEGERDEQDL